MDRRFLRHDAAGLRAVRPDTAELHPVADASARSSAQIFRSRNMDRMHFPLIADFTGTMIEDIDASDKLRQQTIR